MIKDSGEKAGRQNSTIPCIFQGNGHTCLKEAAVPALFTMAVALLPGLTLVLKINKGQGP